MASGSRKKGAPKSAVSAARGSVAAKKQVPWGTISAVAAIVLLAATVFGYYYVASGDQRAQREREDSAEASFAPSRDNPDPSTDIEGVVTETYEGGAHVLPTERVAYDRTPPFGGPHDGVWAACIGTVYEQGVRTENMVHSLEHGAVWIAYNPEKVTGEDLETLKLRVEGKPYTMMSPYPGLDSPISLQSWGHQLKVDSVTDERIDQFIAALRRNPNTYPEVGASCDALGPGQFDPDNPPPFNAEPPGPDAKPMDYDGSDAARQMGRGQQPGGTTEG
ncbi:DUF3105 domain-containing protein [Saccharomonospora halophila]|uniref:DUF3105 domain-containing protein n=1 Tax=Saccharomonospora halophila TaxID=129922 RepID=UPI0003762CDC|nr:DUF3105 domain-containing protein [Saccharomonospora halophila]